MPSQTKENYLKALYALEQEEGQVSLSALSQRLNLSMPTVNSMVKKLKQKGWLKYEKYQPLKLTASGRKMAAVIIRKHRLAEMFLVEKMGFGWEEVHDIAEQMEHIDSDVLFNRMDEILANPTHDPHGSPIPTVKGEVLETNHPTLIECSVNEKVEIVGLKNSSKEFLIFLNKKKLNLGTVLLIIEIELYDQSITLEHEEGNVLILSKEVSENLWVNPILNNE